MIPAQLAGIRHVQNPVKNLHIQNPVMFIILEYSEPRSIWNTARIQGPTNVYDLVLQFLTDLLYSSELSFKDC